MKAGARALAFLAITLPIIAQPSADDWLLPNFALRLSVNVSNPGPKPAHALATLPIAEARAAAPEFPGRFSIAVAFNKAGSPTPATVVASQIDDLDGDGVPDQIEFPVDLAAGEQRRVDIYYSTTMEDSITWPKRVQAKHRYSYNREVAAIESELIGYRTYGGFFLDVMGRAAGNFGLNNDLAAYVPLRRDLGTGRDVFHIGNSLGLGGLFLRRNGKIYQPPMNVPSYAHKPSPAMVPHYRVIAQGPLRAIVETTLADWNLDGDIVRLTARYSIDAGEPFVRCRFEAIPVSVEAGHEYEIGFGIRDMPAGSVSPSEGRIIVTGKQNERDGLLGLAVYFEQNQFEANSTVRTPESMNQAVVSKHRLGPGKSVRGEYTAAAAWSGSGIQNLGAYLANLSEAIAVHLTTGGATAAATPRPDKVEAETQ